MGVHGTKNKLPASQSTIAGDVQSFLSAALGSEFKLLRLCIVRLPF